MFHITPSGSPPALSLVLTRRHPGAKALSFRAGQLVHRFAAFPLCSHERRSRASGDARLRRTIMTTFKDFRQRAKGSSTSGAGGSNHDGSEKPASSGNDEQRSSATELGPR